MLRIALLASIVGSFLSAWSRSQIGFERFPGYAMLVPVAFLLWMIYVDYRKPIADVHKLDLARDPEIAGVSGKA